MLNIIALIPARGGSTSIPSKNLIKLGNKPLLQWSIDTAKSILPRNKIYVSSDDDKILNLAKKNKIKIQKRPKYLSTNNSLVIDTIDYFCKQIAKKSKPIDILILLEPTSPFRKINLIKKSLKRLIDENLDSIASFIPCKTPPERVWRINKNKMSPLFNDKCWAPRQKLEQKYELDGSILIFKTKKNHKNQIIHGKIGAVFLNTKDVIEIDDFEDLYFARFKLKKKDKK